MTWHRIAQRGALIATAIGVFGVTCGVAQSAQAVPVVSVQFQTHWRDEGIGNAQPDVRSFSVRGPGVDRCVTVAYDPARFVWPYWHLMLAQNATYQISSFAAPGCEVRTVTGTIETARAHNWFLSTQAPPTAIR